MSTIGAVRRFGRPASARPRGPHPGIWRKRLALALMIAYALLMFVPFSWSIVTSFKTLPDSVQLTFIPNPFTLDGWDYALTKLQPPLPTLFLNSTLIAGTVTLLNLSFGAAAGYAFARLNFPGREVLFILVLATMMIPDQLRLVPVYVLLTDIGLTSGLGQYLGVMIVTGVSASSIFFMRQYFLTIPRELEEAARIDGAGPIRTFAQVMLPAAAPAIATTSLLAFQGSWNGFFWPLVLLRDQAHWTLPQGLALFRLAGGFSTDYPPLMAAVVMATIPILVLYISFQRFFIQGLAASGVKG